MSRYSHTHPEKVGSDPTTHVPGFGAPGERWEENETPRRLTESRLDPYGRYWTIDDALIEKRERETEAALAKWDDTIDGIAKDLLHKHSPEAR